jgi:hypothetical protein
MKTNAVKKKKKNDENVRFKGKWYAIRNEMPEVKE